MRQKQYEEIRQSDFAKRLGVHRGYINQLLKRSYCPFDCKFIGRIAVIVLSPRTIRWMDLRGVRCSKLNKGGRK